MLRLKALLLIVCLFDQSLELSVKLGDLLLLCDSLCFSLRNLFLNQRLLLLFNSPFGGLCLAQESLVLGGRLFSLLLRLNCCKSGSLFPLFSLDCLSGPLLSVEACSALSGRLLLGQLTSGFLIVSVKVSCLSRHFLLGCDLKSNLLGGL